MDGWIKIYRKLLDWRWYSDTNVTRLFLHLLLMANFEDKDWQNTTIQRGQFATSISRLAEQTNLSIKEIRTALKKLESTGEIVTKGANKFTTITICKYETYQGFENEEGQTKGKQRANEGQTKGKQRATTKEYKNIRTKESNIIEIECCENSQPNAPETKPTQKTLEERERDFYNEVAKFVGKYDREILRAFFDYWSEPNKQKNKMRFELQKTWDTGRRLATWVKREENTIINNQNFKGNGNSRKQGLTDAEVIEAVNAGFALARGEGLIE